jgi:hypothetical protein
MLKKAFLIMLLLGCAFTTSALGQSDFVFEEPLRFTYPTPGSPAQTISFWVFSKEKKLTQVSIRVKEVRDPDGLSVDGAVSAPELQPEEITTDGSRVTLKLNQSLLNKPGEYHVLLLFAGTDANRKKVTATVTPILVRPAAEINVDEIKEQTIEVWRNTPFSTAAVTFRLPLLETTGKAELQDIRWLDQSIFFKDTKKHVPGSVTVVPVSQPTPTAAQTPPPSDAAYFDVKVVGLERAGEFETNLIATSPSFSGRKVIPIRLNVSDAPWFPLLVILCGVGGGFLTNYIAGRWRGRQLNRLTILQLKGELSRWRALVRAPEKAEQVEGMWRQLRNAEEANEISDAAEVKKQLDAIETALDAFRKEEATAKDAALKALATMRSKVKTYTEQSGPLQPDEQGDMQAIGDRLLDAERLIGQDQVDYAQEKLTAADELYTNLYKRRLLKSLARLTAEFNSLKQQTESADQQASKDLINEAHVLLDQNKLDEARTKLEELNAALAELETKKTGPSFARMGPVQPFEEIPRVVEPPQLTRINIITAPGERTTDVDIRFEIVDSQQLLIDDDKFRWIFGEPRAQQENGRVVNYQYREDGDYEVKVDVLRNNQVFRNFKTSITILPGRAGRARAGILENIKSADIMLSIIALVLASVTGLLVFYVGKAYFGSLSDYLLALLWGFGIDNSVRGFAEVLGKIAPTKGVT